MAVYYFRKFFRFMPLNMMCLLCFVYGLPLIGFGPIWNKFD